MLKSKAGLVSSSEWRDAGDGITPIFREAIMYLSFCALINNMLHFQSQGCGQMEDTR